jgi:hypothetical protein
MSHVMLNLPGAGQSFIAIGTYNNLYVDKTKYNYDLVTDPGCNFLSRLRMFGKSGLLGTMAELFRHRLELFKGLQD